MEKARCCGVGAENRRREISGRSVGDVAVAREKARRRRLAGGENGANEREGSKQQQ